MAAVFTNWHDFWQMGGYGAFVWFSYGMMLVIFGCNLLFSRRRYRKLIKLFKSYRSAS